MTTDITFKNWQTIALIQLHLWKTQGQPPVVKVTISHRLNFFTLLTSDMLIKLDVVGSIVEEINHPLINLCLVPRRLIRTGPLWTQKSKIYIKKKLLCVYTICLLNPSLVRKFDKCPLKKLFSKV